MKSKLRVKNNANLIHFDNILKCTEFLLVFIKIILLNPLVHKVSKINMELDFGNNLNITLM